MAQDPSITTASVDALIYRNTSGTFGSPTWAVIANVQDLDVSDEVTKANTTSKGANIGTVGVGYRNVAVNFKMVYVKGDAGYTALATAFGSQAAIHLLVLNGGTGTTGATGYNGDWHVTKFNKSEPLDGQVMYDVTLEPAKTTNGVVDYTQS